MQNQRAHGDDPTGPDRAFDRSNFTNEFVDARRRQATEPMRPRYHAERRVVGTTVVEVHAQRHHATQRLCRRNGVQATAFVGPWSPAWRVHSAANRERKILMPRDEPVRGW